MKEDVFQLGIKGVVKSKNKILLLKVNKAQLLDRAESYWDIPGGRIHRGSSIEDTLCREIAEETGIKNIESISPLDMVLSNIRIPKQLPSGEDVGLILSVYICNVADTKKIVLSKEHAEYNWFDPKEAAKLLSYKYPKEFTEKLSQLQKETHENCN